MPLTMSIPSSYGNPVDGVSGFAPYRSPFRQNGYILCFSFYRSGVDQTCEILTVCRTLNNLENRRVLLRTKVMPRFSEFHPLFRDAGSIDRRSHCNRA